MNLQVYGDQIPPHLATQEDSGFEQPVALAAEWAVDFDTFGATIDVDITAIGYNSAPVDQGGALLVYFGTTPGTLGDFQTFVTITSISSGAPTVVTNGAGGFANPGGRGVVQVGIRRGLDPGDSATVPVTAWGIVVHLVTTP